MTNSSLLVFRPAVAADHATFLRLFAELAVPDPPPALARFVAVIAPCAFIAQGANGQVLGYAYHEVLEVDGYVRHVVVDPDARGMGVGRAIMAELARRFRQGGCTHWRLTVKPDNTAARALYEACGMKPAYAGRVMRVAWSQLASLPAATPAPAGLLASSELGAFEAALELPRGLLASLAARGYLALGVRDADGTPLGASAFDPSFPGTFPFRARNLPAARALLDASLERRIPIDDAERPWRDVGLQVVVEDDEALADRLVANGGIEVLATVHYTGRL